MAGEITTDQIDHITPEERNFLVGFCDSCEIWTHFIRGKTPEACMECGGKFSNRHGLQLTTKRTWTDVKAKRKRK